MKIYFIGLPGSGKTTLGKEVARVLNLPFVDLDQVIEDAAGKSVREIFTEKGEAHFRQLESNQLRSKAESAAGFVMAAGGGSPCFYGGIELMNQTGISVFLDAPISTIARRLAALKISDRPLLTLRAGETLEDKLVLLKNNRNRFYRQATLRITKDSIRAEAIVELIRAHLKK